MTLCIPRTPDLLSCFILHHLLGWQHLSCRDGWGQTLQVKKESIHENGLLHRFQQKFLKNLKRFVVNTAKKAHETIVQSSQVKVKVETNISTETDIKGFRVATSVGRSDRIRTVHLLEAIWKVKLITPLTFSRASSHRPRWSCITKEPC